MENYQEFPYKATDFPGISDAKLIPLFCVGSFFKTKIMSQQAREPLINNITKLTLDDLPKLDIYIIRRQTDEYGIKNDNKYIAVKGTIIDLSGLNNIYKLSNLDIKINKSIESGIYISRIFVKLDEIKKLTTCSNY